MTSQSTERVLKLVRSHCSDARRLTQPRT